MDEWEKYDFREYRKIGITRARVLTGQDVAEMGGVMQTLEGIVNIRTGDYLAVGVAGEQWRISAATFERTKRALGEPDAGGFREYETVGTVQAAQIHKPFEVKLGRGDILSGKSGDYLVRSSSSGDAWIVDRAVFESSYQPSGEHSEQEHS
jgi:PGDYG protein